MKSTLRLRAWGISLMSVLFLSTVQAQCLVTTGPTNNCSYGDAIDVLTIGGTTVSNTGCSGGGSGYTAFATPVWNFDLATNYSLAATVGGGQYEQGLAIWIDLANDGVFDASDLVWVSSSWALNHTGTLNIPTASATGVPVPMRVMCNYYTVATASQACTSNVGSYGETEDYMVILNSPTISDDVELTAVLNPVDNTCGNASDSLYVRVTNNGTNAASNIAVDAVLSGMITTTLNTSIASLASGATQDINLGAINTEMGGTLDIQASVTMTGDLDDTNDTLVTSLTLWNSTDLIISGDSIVCPGDMSELTVNTSGTETYVWTVNTIPMTGDTINVTVIVPQEVIVNSSNTCRAADTIMLTSVPMPTAAYTSSVSGGVVDFTGTATNYNSVSWDFGDGNTGTGLTPSNTYTANGAYWVCMSAIGDCDTVTVCDSVYVTTLSVGSIEWGEVSVFPNPTVDVVTVSITNFLGNKGTWTLFDMNGRALKSDDLKLIGGSATVSVSLADMDKGSYIFRILNEKGEKYNVTLVRQ